MKWWVGILMVAVLGQWGVLCYLVVNLKITMNSVEQMLSREVARLNKMVSGGRVPPGETL